MKYSEMAITVTQLNKYIKDKIDNDETLNQILVKGEISNFKHHYTGHLYFTLKDESCLIKCIMFKSYAQKLKFEPKDGMKVLIVGRVSVFERDGVYQLYANIMEEDGLGDLYAKYQKLKQELEEKGLFDETHKQKIPAFPKTIGVLTSKTGSVIKDIINVGTRRNPNVNIILLPVPVQGDGAGKKIADGIKKMNDLKLVDVLIIGRGGGSLEDLWPFNEEEVAYAIYNSKIPIISAVGHQTDFTIADFVADMRAPTPSAAAELAVPNILELTKKIQTYQARLKMALIKKMEVMKLQYQKVMASRIFQDPLRIINDNYLKIDSYVKELENNLKKDVKEYKEKYIKLISKLDALSPLKTLSRGYSIVSKEDGKIIKSTKSLNAGDLINLRLLDGNKSAKIL